MHMLTRSLVVALLIVAPVAHADDAKKPAPADACPAEVKAAIDKAFPKATITKCKAESEHGHDQFEVKLTKTDGSSAEIDVAPDGKIIQVEEVVALDKVPAAVMKAFAAKYPKAKATRAEKQTPTTGAVSYELAFDAGKGRKEATFTADGKFIEEE